MVLKASLKLFCLPCLVVEPCAEPFVYPTLCSLRGCHRSDACAPPCGWPLPMGLEVREELKPNGSSSCVGSRSGWNGGNLYVTFGFVSSSESEAIIAALNGSRVYGRVARPAIGIKMQFGVDLALVPYGTQRSHTQAVAKRATREQLSWWWSKRS